MKTPLILALAATALFLTPVSTAHILVIADCQIIVEIEGPTRGCIHVGPDCWECGAFPPPAPALAASGDDEP